MSSEKYPISRKNNINPNGIFRKQRIRLGINLAAGNERGGSLRSKSDP